MSGQLGDVPPPAVASPKKQPPAPVPAPSSTPAPAAVDSKPVVEAADPTPTAPETKVEPTNTPTPALNPPDQGAPLPEPASQEIPNVNEQKESLVQPESEHEAADSESKSQSSPTIPAEPQLSNSEKIATDQPLPEPETEPSDAVRETQGALAAEVAAVEQQIGFKEEGEKQPQSEGEPSDVKQQEHSEPVAETPEVQKEESGSENATQDLSLAVEGEPQNASTDTGLERATVPAEPEIEPQSEIIQAKAAALPTDDVKEDPCPEKLSDKTEKPTEPIEALSSETVSQEVPLELDSKTDGTATNVKEEKLVTGVELVEPSQNSQFDESQTTAAGQAPSDSVDAAISQEQADITTKSDAKNEASNKKIEVAEVTKVEPGEIVHEPIITEAAMPPPVDAVENVTPDDKISVPKLDGTQQEEPAKCEESESSVSAASEIQHAGSGSEEEIKVHAEEKKLTEKEEQLSPPKPAEKSLPVSPTEEASASEQTEQQSTTENEISIEKVSVVGEIAQQEIPQRADAETSAEMKTTTAAAEERNDEKKSAEEETIEEGAIKEAGAENESSNSKAFEEDNVGSDAAAERAVEGQADKESALEKEATEEKTVEKANDQKSQKEEDEEVKRDESGPKPCDETENLGLVMEKKEAEKAGEPASAVAEPIPKDEAQVQKVIETKVESDISQETEKHSSELEGGGQKEHKQTSVDRMLNADDECENPVVTSEEKVNGKESAESEQMVSGVIAETHGGDKTCEEKLAQDVAAAASQETECVPENHSETKKETVALTDNDKKALEEVSEQKEPVKGGDEKLDEEEVASQPVASEVQTPVSFSEPNAPRDKDAAAQCDADAESKMGEVTEAADENKCAPVSVTQAPVAEPELPVSVVGEQEKGPQEENSQSPKPSGDDGADEVTVAFSSSVRKSHGSSQSVTPIVSCHGK